MLPHIIIATLLVSFVSLIGGIFLVFHNTLREKHTMTLVSFAAGVILSAAFLDLLPEAIEAGSEPHDILLVTLLGVVVFFFLERFLVWHHHHDDEHGLKPSAFLILLGDGVHNFIDGVVIAATFLVNPAVGYVTTLAIAAHEIPQEIADYFVLTHGGMKSSKALFFNFLSGLTALAGAIGAYFFLQNLEPVLPYLLAFSAGMFIYIGCADLIPDLHKDAREQKRWSQAIPFVVGITGMYFLVTLLHG